MNEKIAALSKLQKYMQYTVIGLLILMIAGFVFAIKRNPIAFLLGILLLAGYLFLFRGLIHKYRRGVKIATMEESFRSFFKNIVYEEKGNAYKQDISNAHFVPAEHENNILIRDTLSGTYQAKPVRLMDITTDYIATNRNYLSGCYFTLQLRKEMPDSFMLWSKNCLEESALDHYFADMQEPEIPAGLAKDFYLFVPAGTELPKLSEDFITAVLRLYEYTPGEVAIQVAGDKLNIFIRNRFLYLRKVEIKYELTPQMLQANPFPEMNYLLRVADALQK